MVDSTEEPPVSETAFRATLEKVTSREDVIKTEWLNKTKDIYDIYEGGKADETPFNILYSNTEVLVPNLFSNTPKVIVRKRFGEMRADEASQAAERMAEYCLDTNISGYPDFTDAIEAAVLDAALPGQGQCRIRVVDGIACLDYVQHDKFIWGYAQRWEDVPWIAYRHDKTHADAVREFGISETIAAEMKKTEEANSDSSEDKKGPATSPYYEVWDKQSRKVCFLTPAYSGVCVAEMDDPLNLSSFYPSIKPLRLLSTPRSTMPRATYDLYKQQAKELNLITERIRRVASAIQVRGLFDGNMTELGTIFESGNAENKLIAAANPATMMRDGGLDKHIWLIPIDKFIVVLQNLYQVRDQIKATIYEILGIGDILRGVTQASETASAQQIKDKWGSLRIKKSREKVSHFVRGYVRLIIEAAADHTEEETWAKVTGLPYMSSIEARTLAAQGPALPGAPPPPPSWDKVLGSLRDDLTRSYIIDIETNSTVDADATQDKEEVTEFMNALGQAMTGLEGLAAAGPEGFEASKAMLVEICKRFRMGGALQGLIQKMQPPPKGPTPEQEQMDKELEQKKGEAEQGQEQLKAAMDQAQAQFDQQQDQLKQIAEGLLDQQRKIKEEQAALAEQASELELRFREMQLELQGKQLELKAATAQLGQEVGKAQLDLQGKEQTLQGKEQSLKIQQSAEPVAPAATSEADKATSAAIEAIAAQGKVLETLLQTLANPPKMVIKKTGPATFERTAS